MWDPRAKLNRRNQVYPADWFPLTVPSHESQPTPEQQALVTEARDLFAALRPARARNTWAVIYGDLILVVLLDRHQQMPETGRGSLHTSLQLLMGVKGDTPVIVGAWQDSHYAWDYDPKQPDFQITGHNRDSRKAALDWLVSEMRRPIIRYDLRILGMGLGSTWRHDDPKRSLVEARGFLPLVWLFRNRPAAGIGAGYLTLGDRYRNVHDRRIQALRSGAALAMNFSMANGSFSFMNSHQAWTSASLA